MASSDRKYLDRSMSEFQTLSRRGRLRFWGWGLEGLALTPEEEAMVRASAARFGTDLTEIKPPEERDFTLRKPRIDPPAGLTDIVSTTRYDRLVHSLGKS